MVQPLDIELVGGRGVDFQSRQLTAPLTIGIARGRIACVAPTTDTTLGTADVVIDVSGHFVSAGLVDMHVHLCHEPRAHRGLPFAHDEGDDRALLRAVQNLSEMLLQGVCLVRDVGGRDGPLRTIATHSANSEVVLPEVESSGRPFCVPRGHGHEFGQTLSSAATIDDAIAAHAALGHRWVKIMNGPELWQEVELRRLCSAAHDHDLRVAVHAFSDAGVWPAILASADTVEHCLVSSDEMAAAAVAHGTTFVPTAFAAKTSLAKSFATTMSAIEVRYLEEWFAYLESGVAFHQRAGLPALIGTDAGCAPCQAQDVIEEMLLLERWGFASIDVLEWATKGGAGALDRSSDFGEISVGRFASLIVLDRDPTASVECCRDPVLVLHKGVPVRDRIGVCLA